MITVVVHAWGCHGRTCLLKGCLRGVAVTAFHPTRREACQESDGRLDEDSIRLGGRVCVLSRPPRNHHQSKRHRGILHGTNFPRPGGKLGPAVFTFRDMDGVWGRMKEEGGNEERGEGGCWRL